MIRWTAADPQIRWLRMNAHGLDVDVRDVSESVAAVALQGPLSRAVLEAATGAPSPTCATSGAARATLAGIPIDVSRTGYTGDLGYELWIPAERAVEAWDALAAAGAPYRLRPAGMLALDVVAPGGGPDPDRGRLHERGPLPHPEPELLAVRDRPGPAGRPGLGRLRRPARARRRDGGRRPGAASRRARHRLAGHRGAPRGPGPGRRPRHRS